MSYDITLKRGDTRNCIKAILKDNDGDPVDLTGCEIKFIMAPLVEAGRKTVEQVPEKIKDAVQGRLSAKGDGGVKDAN